MKITVIGCGRWGTFIAYYLHSIGEDTTLYGKEGDPTTVGLLTERKNSYLTLPDDLHMTTDLYEATDTDTIVISVPSQALRGLFAEIAECDTARRGAPVGRRYILCMKGIEIETGERLSEVTHECAAPGSRVACWIGPGHVEEFLRGVPNCMIIDSDDEALKHELADEFSSPLIRFYYGCDLIGSEIGAAAKNVIGIAAGMLDGFGLSALKGALMSRGTYEISRLIGSMGGDPGSAYGLCHLGDYEATVFSAHSHNRMFGESFVRGEKYTSLAEGYYTVDAIMRLSEKYNVELPICSVVYDILYRGADPKMCLDSLFRRKMKDEFWSYPTTGKEKSQ